MGWVESTNVELYNVFELRFYHLKQTVMFYVSFMVSIKQKPIVHTQKIERNLSIPLQKITKSLENRLREERNKGITGQPENNLKNGYKPIHINTCKWTKCF